MKRLSAGITLVELIVAIVLFTVVLLTATNLMMSFGNFSSHFSKNEAGVMGTAIGGFEEIVARISVSNQVTIPSATHAAPSVDIRVAPTGPAISDHTADVLYTYWVDQKNLRRTGVTGDPVGGTVLAQDIESATFSQVGTTTNLFDIALTAQPAKGHREELRTVAVARSRSAQ